MLATSVSRSGLPSASAASVDESAGDASVCNGAGRVEKVTSKLIWGIGEGVGVGAGAGAGAGADEDAPPVSESAITSATCSSSVKKEPSA